MVNPKLNEEFEIQTKERLGYTVCILTGSFSVKNLFHVRTRLQELFEVSVNNIVLDFENCSEIDSSGLGLLSNIYKKLGSDGGELGAVNVSPAITKVLNETGLNNILVNFASLEDADSHYD